MCMCASIYVFMHILCVNVNITGARVHLCRLQALLLAAVSIKLGEVTSWSLWQDEYLSALFAEAREQSGTDHVINVSFVIFFQEKKSCRVRHTHNELMNKFTSFF